MRRADRNPGEQVLDLWWEMVVGGYRWVTAITNGERPCVALPEDDPCRNKPEAGYRQILVPANLTGENTKRYRPLEKPDLHRALSAVKPSVTGILEFANEYGTLGLKRQTVDLTPLVDSPNLFPIFAADSLSDWQTEIKDLRKAIALWDSVKNFEGDAPTKLDRIAAAMKPRLGDLQGVPVRRENGRGLVMRFGPKSLCGAAWLLFEQETEGYFDLLQCRECGRLFKYFPDQIKTPRVFCSQGCRSKAYRKRQKEARRLHAEGVAVAEIALRLRSDRQTIAEWISKGGLPSK